jgi:hypothetical protein
MDHAAKLHQHQRRKKQAHRQTATPQQTQIDPLVLQRVIEEPTVDLLTPEITNHLQSNFGNQYVSRLIQRALDNGETQSITTNPLGTIQRKFPPYNESNRKLRNRYFNSYQANRDLKDAFGVDYGDTDTAIEDVSAILKSGGETFRKWQAKQTKAKKSWNPITRSGAKSYQNVWEIVAAEDWDTFADLRWKARKDYTVSDYDFMRGAYLFRKNPSPERFHQMMDTYIYEGARSKVNIAAKIQLSLIERAYRMEQGTL